MTGLMDTARLNAIATASPSYRLSQDVVKDWAGNMLRERFGDTTKAAVTRLLDAYDNAGIDTRYSCVPLDWYDETPSWSSRNRLFVENAVDLLEAAARSALDKAGLDVSDIDSVVAVSTSGIATPSLDALLIDRLQLPNGVNRLPIFGLGCAGGVTGLARAADLAKARPGETVLYCVVELCGLTFRRSDLSKSNIIATALFGDGAAAAILNTKGDGPRITRSAEHTWRDSLGVMGWKVEDDGLGVLFSKDIPALVRTEFDKVLARYLDEAGFVIEDFDGFICHPGGAKVIDALEGVFGLPEGGLVESRSILREFGNMSAATVLFVMERALKGVDQGRYLASALGPGFTSALLTLEFD